jgi:SAM-dependent methyltransferase
MAALAMPESLSRRLRFVASLAPVHRMNALKRWLRPCRAWYRRLTSNRTEGLKFETSFWDDFFRTQGLQWPDDFKRRLNPQAPLADRQRASIDRLALPEVRIIDVGAGPLTILGKTHPTKKLSIIAVDPLAAEYDRLLAKYGHTPPVRTIAGSAEKLVEQFGENAFDFAYAENCLDHAEDPVVAIEQMVRIVKPGCDAMLHHAENEAENQEYTGLHQWNFTCDQGRFYVTGKNRRTDVAEALASIATVTNTSTDGWMLTVLRKKG